MRQSDPGIISNRPLTLEQLRRMDGCPVWVEDLRGDRKSEWKIIYWDREKYLTFASHSEDGFILDEYGETWVAYLYPYACLNMKAWVDANDCLPEDSGAVKKLSDPHFEMCSVIACGKMSGGLGWIVKETNRYVSHKTGVEYIDSITTNAGREFDKWYWADGWECVTHWMPLPGLPEVTI